MHVTSVDSASLKVVQAESLSSRKDAVKFLLAREHVINAVDEEDGYCAMFS
jgi:hypothetical protein